MMRPAGYPRMSWDILAIFVLAFDLIWIPMVAFNPPETPATTVCGWTTTVYWTLDVLMSFIVGYYDRRGNLVMSYRLSAIRYASSWLVLDILIISMDWVAIFIKYAEKASSAGGAGNVGIARVGKLARVGRLFRALRLLRLMKIRRVMFMIQERIDSEYVSIIISLAKNTATLLCINHAIACLWFWVGNQSTSNWIDTYSVNGTDIGSQYLWAFHWSMSQFTPGTNQVQPQSSLERFFALFVLVFGMLVFSSFVSSNTTALTRLRNLTGTETQQQFLLRKFLNENRISRDLSARVLRYIDLVKAHARKKVEASKVEYLALLSGPLNIELQRELIEPHLIVHPFFDTYSRASLPAISQICATAASTSSLSKGDILFNSGSKADNMIFVTVGKLMYHRAKGAHAEWRKLRVEQGNWACEAVLWLDAWVHKGTMIAYSESELVALHGATFCGITGAHPDAFEIAVEHARNYLRAIQLTMMMHGKMWDISEETIKTAISPGRSASLSERISGFGGNVFNEENMQSENELESSSSSSSSSASSFFDDPERETDVQEDTAVPPRESPNRGEGLRCQEQANQEKKEPIILDV